MSPVWSSQLCGRRLLPTIEPRVEGVIDLLVRGEGMASEKAEVASAIRRHGPHGGRSVKHWMHRAKRGGRSKRWPYWIIIAMLTTQEINFFVCLKDGDGTITDLNIHKNGKSRTSIPGPDQKHLKFVVVSQGP